MVNFSTQINRWGSLSLKALTNPDGYLSFRRNDRRIDSYFVAINGVKGKCSELESTVFGESEDATSGVSAFDHLPAADEFDRNFIQSCAFRHHFNSLSALGNSESGLFVL